ncbi:MAG: hypothetical protein HQ484_03975 [Candidatus Aquiluna sp.]|nr:hypothetical protein [Aquiluna sp.]
MAIRPVILDVTASKDQVLTISRGAIRLSAKFIRGNRLEDMNYVEFFDDDENPYWLGFRLTQARDHNHSQKLNASSDSALKSISAQALIRTNPVLSAIAKLEDRSSRMFEISFDEKNSYWFVFFRPTFERQVFYVDKSNIPRDASGIYRYFDKNDELLYIGKGNIKGRLESLGRDQWGIHRIEFSTLQSEEDALKWESFHLSEFKRRFGQLPTFNRIAGHSQD